MTLLSRRIRAIPYRSAMDTWGVIVNLVAGVGSDPGAELLKVDGIAACLITSEGIKNSPIVVRGKGPCVRLYCLYGENAIVGDAASETVLPTFPTENEWSVSLPCPGEDLNWVQAALSKQSNRITARDMTEPSPLAEHEAESSATAPIIDTEEFLRS